MVVWVSSDSQYVRKGILEWIRKWKRNGWRNSKKQGVANATLWRELDAEIARHRHVAFTWVKGHKETWFQRFWLNSKTLTKMA
jgi:ribonuclease HI